MEILEWAHVYLEDGLEFLIGLVFDVLQHINKEEYTTGGEKGHVDGCDNEESDPKVICDQQNEDELVSQTHSLIAKYR